MSDDGTPIRLAPASPEAVAMAAAWFAGVYRDEAEALLALELAFERALRMRPAIEQKEGAR